MKKQTETEKLFIEIADQKLVEELWEEVLFAELLPFHEFVQRYQERHLAKYGTVLTLKSKKR